MSAQRQNRGSGEVFANQPYLLQPTAQVSRGIFVRFLLVAVGVYALVGTAVVVYDVADHIWSTRDHLQHTSLVISRVAIELRRRKPDKSDQEVVSEAARLTQAPMALLSREDGELLFATAQPIREMVKRVYQGRPKRGTQVMIEQELSWLSGAWTVSPFSKTHDLLVIAIRLPEEEGLAQYMTIAAGIIGLGLVLCFVSMLAAANWVLKRPLHRLVERAASAADEQLNFRNNLIDSSQAVGIVGADDEGRIQIFNRAAERILGYQSLEVEDTVTLEELKQQSHGPPVDRTQDRLPALVRPREGEEVWLDRAGREHLLDVSANPILDTEGSFKGQLVTFVDITERRRLEVELHQSELQLMQSAKMATLGEMATGVAHELNQPLNNIGLLTSRMAMRLGKLELDSEQEGFYREKLDKVRKQVDRAGKIIDHLRTFGRPTGRRLDSLAVHDSLHGVVDLVSEQLTTHGITLTLDLPTDLPQVIADEGQLEQVVMNLVVNARDALDSLPVDDARDKRITIQGRRCALVHDAAGVVIQVTDNGPGIPQEVQERIFDPFFSTKEVGKGTGLGLSISYGLVRDFGGILEVDSVMDKRTTFSIRLKAASSGSPAAGVV